MKSASASASPGHHDIRRLCGRVFLSCCLGSTAVHAQTAAPLALYHRFEAGSESVWATVSVPLRGDAWRVGSADGAVASPDQLRAMLSSLHSVVIGCRCEGADASTTHYPCLLEVVHPRVNGLPAEDDDVQDPWSSTSGSTLFSPQTGVHLAASVPERELRATGAVVASDIFSTGPGYLGLIVPKSLRTRVGEAHEQSIAFDIRARSSPLAPSRIDPGSGLIIMSTQRLGNFPTPRRDIKPGHST